MKKKSDGARIAVASELEITEWRSAETAREWKKERVVPQLSRLWWWTGGVRM